MIYICERCYQAECERRGVAGLEVYTSAPHHGAKCDFCGDLARYIMPGEPEQFALGAGMRFEGWLLAYAKREDKSGLTEAPQIAMARAAWRAAIEEAAKACEACMGFDEDDPGSSAAAAVRKIK